MDEQDKKEAPPLLTPEEALEVAKEIKARIDDLIEAIRRWQYVEGGE